MLTHAPLRRRLAAACALATGALVLAACGGSGHASSGRRVTVKAPASSSSSGSVTTTLSGAATESTGGCPGVTYAPGNPYTLTISGTIRGSLVFAHDDYGSPHPAVIPHIAARFCGSLNVATEAGTVAPNNISFAPAHVYFDYHLNKKHKPVYSLQDKVTFFAVGNATAQVNKSSAAANGGLEVSLTSEVDTWVYPEEGDNSVKCLDGPVSLDLSTQNTGGSALVGPLQNASVNVAQQGFTVPAAALGQSTCQSGSIDDAAIINALLALPADDTSTVETFTADVSD